MLNRCRHCLLALLMILQSVSAAWAQVPVQVQVHVHVIGAPQVAPPQVASHAMLPGVHCPMMEHAISAGESQDLAPSKEKSACHCCDKPCSSAQCAAMHLQAALPDLNIAMPFALTERMSVRYSQIAAKLYLAPPTPPPNPARLS